MTEQYLSGKRALVTGAGQGMGTCHARALAARGAFVVCADRTITPSLNELAAEINGTASGFDVCDADAARAAASPEATGPIDVLVLNHAYMSMGDFLDYDEDDWWRVVETNLTGTRNVLHAVLPGMPEGSRIVVISSEWGITGWPEATAYAASKSGLVSLVKTLARELAPRRIAVNALAPGVISTPQLQVDASAAGVPLEEMIDRYASEIPARRVGQPEEVAQAVALLADPTLGAMTGQTIQINGAALRCRV
ncbi:SDR family NAD(P)-dependent oxidoreductase [Sinomonas gamaensis]|uniref:SDR family NAD(P)-dependent oxidoreductase n=1 Tax=Sinomonas gamaensis TaxID=2565624 RepID=UPI0020160904|nr:SDR family NAD(P)-dependent oxidoreductase [Sinomonas gamaensis]